MKKLLMVPLIVIILLISTQAFAASIFTTTIRDCTSQQVEDTLIEIMTGKNFVVNEVTPYKITFDKNFGDGFWVAAQIQQSGSTCLPEMETLKSSSQRQKKETMVLATTNVNAA